MSAAMLHPTAAHRAALSLHSLPDPDRQWVLQGLGADQQAALAPLLHELQALGIPRDVELARAIAGDDQGDRPVAASALQALDAAGVHRLAAILVLEPPCVAAALLARRRWPWHQQLLSELPPAFVRDIAHVEPRLPAASALQAAVEAELESCVSARAVQPRASVWQGLRRRLSNFGGTR